MDDVAQRGARHRRHHEPAARCTGPPAPPASRPTPRPRAAACSARAEHLVRPTAAPITPTISMRRAGRRCAPPRTRGWPTIHAGRADRRGASTALNHRHLPDMQTTPCMLADYFLAQLPPDRIALWDLSLPHDSEPRDSSACAIAACGLLEIAEQLPARRPAPALSQRRTGSAGSTDAALRRPIPIQRRPVAARRLPPRRPGRGRSHAVGRLLLSEALARVRATGRQRSFNQ
jgi:hypothetical protein